MPIDPGTLSGFDQLLSISQEAIQRQLKMLYLTEVDPPIPNGPTHLINHEMNFHLAGTNTKTGKKFFHKDGLDAYVCCPELELGGQKFKDSEDPDRYRTAVVRFKFRAAEDWEVSEEQVKAGKRKDSIFIYKNVYEDDDGESRVDFPEVIINGWEISWDTLLDRKDIQDVFAEIIQPAESDKSPVAITDTLKARLKTVSEKNFQISTIFCAMQSARLVKSFRIVDEHGNKPSKVKNTKGEDIDVQTMIDSFVNTITNRFTCDDTAQNEGLGPTPDNPFILGYTMSSKTPSLKDVNPAAAQAGIPTPVYFVPKSFRINLSPTNNYSAGTMNYCMLTHRWDVSQERHINYGVDGAGRFPSNIFSRVKTKAVPGSAEGALFFAQDIFMNWWIRTAVAPLFYLDPRNVGYRAVESIEKNYKHLNMPGMMARLLDNKPEFKQTSVRTCTLTDSCQSDRRLIARNAANDFTESVKMIYQTKVDVSYENASPLTDSDDDLKRRLKMTITSCSHLKIKFYRRLFSSHSDTFRDIGIGMVKSAFGGEEYVPNFQDDKHWEEAYDMDLWLNFKYKFFIGSSAKDRGSFEISELVAEHLDKNGDLIATNDYASPEDRPGMWYKTKMHNFAEFFEFAFGSEKSALTSISTSVATDGATRIKGALDDLVKSLGSTVILPAGGVFMFKGLSTDDDGNVFTTINYDTSTEDKIHMQDSKDVLHTRWQAPTKPVKA